jgi:hypothetical protein
MSEQLYRRVEFVVAALSNDYSKYSRLQCGHNVTVSPNARVGFYVFCPECTDRAREEELQALANASGASGTW